MIVRYCLRTDGGYIKFKGSGGHTTIDILPCPNGASFEDTAEAWEQGVVHNIEHALDFYVVPYVVVEKVYFRSQEEADGGI